MFKYAGLIAGGFGFASGFFICLSIEYSMFFMIGSIMFAALTGVFAAIADES